MYKDNDEKQQFKEFLIEQGLSKATSENYAVVLCKKKSTNHKTAVVWFRRFQTIQTMLSRIQSQEQPQPQPIVVEHIAGVGKVIDTCDETTTDDCEIVNELTESTKIIETNQKISHTDIYDEHKIVLIRAILLDK